MSKILFSQRSENYKTILSKEMMNITSFFKQTFNLDIYLIFGTLLGAIREKDFIGHDYDVDLAYISNFKTKKNVIKEFVNICDILNKNKLLIKRKGVGQLHCKSLENKMKFDIWTSYQVSENEIDLKPIDFLIPTTVILPLKTIMFRKFSFNIPNKSTELMNLLYKDWETPILTDFRKFEMK
jgi:phosphorylcholine metabolism protein LicD